LNTHSLRREYQSDTVFSESGTVSATRKVMPVTASRDNSECFDHSMNRRLSAMA
jgi:hypothetical protein